MEYWSCKMWCYLPLKPNPSNYHIRCLSEILIVRNGHRTSSDVQQANLAQEDIYPWRIRLRILPYPRLVISDENCSHPLLLGSGLALDWRALLVLGWCPNLFGVPFFLYLFPPISENLPFVAFVALDAPLALWSRLRCRYRDHLPAECDLHLGHGPPSSQT